MIYYARVVGTVEYCITPGRAELEPVRNRNWRVRAEVLDPVRGPSIRLVSTRKARFFMNASVDACRFYLISFSLPLPPSLSLSLFFQYGNGINSVPMDFLRRRRERDTKTAHEFLHKSFYKFLGRGRKGGGGIPASPRVRFRESVFLVARASEERFPVHRKTCPLRFAQRRDASLSLSLSLSLARARARGTDLGRRAARVAVSDIAKSISRIPCDKGRTM